MADTTAPRLKRKKEYLEQNVYEKALERIRYCYQRFDQVYVNFSGGKDSTTVLNLTIEVARELGKLPVKAIFWDEEAIHPPTVEYVERVRDNPDVELIWYALPVVHRNACSNEQPFWTCWGEEDRAKWIRELPPTAIRTHPNFVGGMSWQEFSDVQFGPEMGTVCQLTGIRTQESLRRYKAVTIKRNDNYITEVRNGNCFKAHPIYDWSSTDVWLAVHKFEWDYNRMYEVLERTQLNHKYLQQRCCPPFGEEPLRGLWLYAECWPAMWHKMLARVPGVATAWRYSNTELYGIGKLEKPEEVTWRQYAELVLDTYSGEERATVIKHVNGIITRHYNKTDDEIPESDVHPLTGTSWEFLAKLAIKGDFKGRTAPKLEQAAITAQKKLGLGSYEAAQEKYGKKPSKPAPYARKR